MKAIRIKAVLTGILIFSILSILSATLIYATLNSDSTFVYVFLFWFIACMAAFWFFSAENLKLTALYIGSAFFAFGIYEAYLCGWFSEPEASLLHSEISDPDYFQKHPILGGAPKKQTQVRATKSFNGEILYDVQYTINEYGIREGGNVRTDSANAVLFYGGSFTFGEGVKDEETLPYQFEQNSDGQFNAHNFGFHGYGPHQMLVALERETEKEVIQNEQPKHLIYSGIPDHVDRCNGLKIWDQRGPKYTLNEEGKAVYHGAFQSPFRSRVLFFLGQSKIFMQWTNKKRDPSEKEIDVYIGIVKEAANIFKNRYGGQFHVVFWDDKSTQSDQIISKLRANRISVFKVSDILPNYFEELGKYQIHPIYEGHPSPLAHKTIALHLLSNLDNPK